MMRLRESLGRRVIARDSAEEIGRLTRLLVDVRTARIASISVGEMPGPGLGTAAVAGVFGGVGESSDEEPGPAILLDWSDITGFGPDAIVAPSAEALRPPASDRERDLASGVADLLERRVLTDRGDILGSIGDVVFDEADGRITGLVIDGEETALTRLVAIGPFAAIIGAPAG